MTECDAAVSGRVLAQKGRRGEGCAGDEVGTVGR